MGAVSDTNTDSAERRVAPRMRVLKRAKIIFNNGFSTFDCVVRNLSSTGALLTLAESAHMPRDFTIKIGESGSVRPARLVYRRTMFAGIRFLDVDSDGEIDPTGAVSRLAEVAESLKDGQPAIEEGGIRKIVPETLPQALTTRFRWK